MTVAAMPVPVLQRGVNPEKRDLGGSSMFFELIAMDRLSASLIRKLRSALKGWSKEEDRKYHDGVFRSRQHDPFTFRYAGYVTICRFADLASGFLQGSRSILDLGCGTGEITCELARRHPHAGFTGVDHSREGIERATEYADRLGLGNLSFVVADVETFEPARSVDIVLLFDAFHHLSDPRRFVERVKRFSPRLLLIEPRGDWMGGWRKDLDFDWLALELDKIRSRLDHCTGEREPAPRGRDGGGEKQEGAPVEHRYGLPDFRRMFAGYGLRIRGTVSGLDAYPPDPYGTAPSRERFGRFAYELYRTVDDLLYERNLDLLAKHWVIFAEKGAPDAIRVPAEKPAVRRPDAPVQGPYDVEYLEYDGPRGAPAGEAFRARVRLRNRSFRSWSSLDPDGPVHLSYHWLDRKGLTLVHDGERSPFPRSIAPGEECLAELRVKACDKAGRYILAVDLVREGAAWFSDGGSPCLRVPFRVARR
jgi:SAM-dependent methyltransferase